MIPDFEINTANGPNPDDMIIDLNGFYLHMFDFLILALTAKIKDDRLCRFIDEENNIFTSTLDEEGYNASLNKCLVYFENIEEFEKCTIIKSLINGRI